MLLSNLLNRNHESYFWRTLAIVMLAFTLLLFHSPHASAAPLKAGEEGNDGASIVALDALCVDGLVINHQEQPLGGWSVTATYVEPGGAATSLTAVSDESGKFHFDLGEVGRWQFKIAMPASWRAVTDASFEVNVAYGSAHCLDIRFKVEQTVEVIVLKIDDDHTPLANWTIIATPGNNNPYNKVHKAVTDADGRATFLLPPGHWIFT